MRVFVYTGSMSFTPSSYYEVGPDMMTYTWVFNENRRAPSIDNNLPRFLETNTEELI